MVMGWLLRPARRLSWRALLALLLPLWLPAVAQAQAQAQAERPGAPVLGWLSTDLTPAARTATLQRLAREAGWTLRIKTLPLRPEVASADAERLDLRQWLGGGLDRLWVDAPHAQARSRLQAAGVPAAAPGLAWIGSEAETQQAPPPLAHRGAGGESNLRLALAWALAQQQGRPLPALGEPQRWPQRGVVHADGPAVFADAQALQRWADGQPALAGRPAVALLVHRSHFVNGDQAWLIDWLRRFERRGLLAYAVFASAPDAPAMQALLAAADGRAQARVLVLHQLLPQAAQMQAVFERLGAPVLATQPWRHGDAQSWQDSPTGLPSGDLPFYLAQPEMAGAIDPMVVSAQGAQPGQMQLLVPQAEAVVAKAARLVRLQDRPRAQRRLALMVYRYPPGGGHFGASFLNVPRSLVRLGQGLAEAGYDVPALDEATLIARLQPLLLAYEQHSDLAGLLARDEAAALPLADYRRWWQGLPAPVRQRIAQRWGPPEASRYLVQHGGQPVFVVPRLRFGHLTVMPQPPREDTLVGAQQPFMHRSAQPLSHHYLATYLWLQDQDALLHFGTHGTQEWAPGKSRGLSVLDDALLPLADMPVVYPYIVDNLGEALTAKRRGRAVMISHRTPSFGPAGFNQRMHHMHELMHEWETVDEGPTRRALEQRLTAQFVEHQLHRDLGWTAERIEAHFAEFLELLHPWLDQLAQSAQPQGLAVLGQVPTPAQRQTTLLQALREPLIEALGEDIDEAFLIDHSGIARSRPARWLQAALQDPQAASRLDLRPTEPEGPVPNRAARRPIDTAALLQLGQRAQALEALLATEGELPGLLQALDGRFVPAAYGGDPLRNPDSLPTGRNLSGLDPQRLPTRTAYETAQTLFNQWLSDWRASHGGREPAKLALTLWAGETLRHQGVMEAQALVALGVAPVWDANGRPSQLRLIPAAELGRARVDVLLSITGSYRDQFPALTALIERAVALVVEAEPQGRVARHSDAATQALRRQGVAADLASALGQARVFGNAAGQYGTGLAEATLSDGLRDRAGTPDDRLGALFLAHMGQPYRDGQPLPGVSPAVAAQALGAQLRQTEAALLARSSNLYGMASSDDPFQYLGGLAAAARAAGRPQGLELFVSRLESAGAARTEPAARTLAAELQTRYLHPGWLAAQQAEGWSGTLQVLKAAQFLWGWQTVAPGMVRDDHWQSLYDVLLRDRHGLGLPAWLRQNPRALQQTLERLIQAERSGHWRPSDDTRQSMAALYQELSREVPLPAEMASVRRWVAQNLPPQPAPARAAPPPAAAQAVAAPAAPRAAAPLRQGIRLRPQAPAEAAAPPAMAPVVQRLAQLLGGASVAALLLSGAAWQWRRRGHAVVAPAFAPVSPPLSPA